MIPFLRPVSNPPTPTGLTRLFRHGLPIALVLILTACNELKERKIDPDAVKAPVIAAVEEVLPGAFKSEEPKVEPSEAQVRQSRIRAATFIDAWRLAREFQDNVSVCEQKYRGQQLLVAGVVDSFGRDMQGRPYLMLGDDGPQNLFRVQCFTKDDGEDLSASFESGQIVFFLGTCQGRVFHVLFDDCEWLDRAELASIRPDIRREVLKNLDPEEAKALAERDRAAREKAEQDRLAAEKAEKERKQKEAAEKAKAEKEKAEQLAASNLKLIKGLIADGKVVFARKSLMSLISTYPQTAAAEEARRILVDLQ